MPSRQKQCSLTISHDQPAIDTINNYSFISIAVSSLCRLHTNCITMPEQNEPTVEAAVENLSVEVISCLLIVHQRNISDR